MNAVKDQTPRKVIMNVIVHAEIRKALRQAANAEDLTIAAKLHQILCVSLRRKDLLQEIPDYSESE